MLYTCTLLLFSIYNTILLLAGVKVLNVSISYPIFILHSKAGY